jgi:D-serine deaminase-like pyridoxal phosphate-dependent protein
MISETGIHKSQLDTPCLVIDKAKLIHNIQQMQIFATERSKAVRPHAKTHKCSEICQLQIENGAIGICVTKVSEAYWLARYGGVSGILITSPVVTSHKIEKLIETLNFVSDTMVVIDNNDNANDLNAAMCAAGKSLDVLVDIDAGIGRTGIQLKNSIDLAVAINQLPNLNFKGIQCYSGHIQHIKNLDERREASHNMLKQAGEVKQKLVEMGLDCHIQTGSGTGTFSVDSELDCVTEIQPGSYTVMDSEYDNIEYMTEKFLPAMTMMTTVISANQDTHVTVDAGTKALYKVDEKPKVLSPNDLVYDWDYFGDEHGKITPVNNAPLPKLGDVVELVVAHCDPTINLFDYFYITENDIVVDKWEINLRGCAQ